MAAMGKIAKTADRKKVMDTTKSTDCPKCGKATRIVKRVKDRERGVPGVRPAGSGHGDQVRVATPAEAIAAGASYIVVGRPITEAADPVAEARAILRQMGL